MAKARSAMTAPTEEAQLEPLQGQRQLTSDDGLEYGELVYLAYHGSVDDNGEVLQDGLDFGPKALSTSRDNLIWPLAAGVWRGRVLAASIMIITLNDDYWIDPILVHPDFRRQGLADQLIRWASGELHNMGASRLRLAVTDDNAPAVSLYCKLGFTQDGPWPSLS